MPIAPVHVPAGATVLVTRETSRRRWLLTPHPILDEQILGILGRAHALAPVELHGFTFLPGRADLLMTVPDRDRMSMFLQYVFKFISDAIRTERRWRWDVWSTRSTIDVLDPVRSIGALRSVHAGAVLGGLVPHPTDWPGVSSAAALLDDEEILTLWTPAKERRLATRDDRILGASRVYHLPLAPIPVLETSPRTDRVAPTPPDLRRDREAAPAAADDGPPLGHGPRPPAARPALARVRRGARVRPPLRPARAPRAVAPRR